MGDGGGGIATELETLARGVFWDTRLRVKDKEGEAIILGVRTPAAFGVENGDPGGRVGDDRLRDTGLEMFKLALSPDFGGLSPPSRSRELNC